MLCKVPWPPSWAPLGASWNVFNYSIGIKVMEKNLFVCSPTWSRTPNTTCIVSLEGIMKHHLQIDNLVFKSFQGLHMSFVLWKKGLPILLCAIDHLHKKFIGLLAPLLSTARATLSLVTLEERVEGEPYVFASSYKDSTSLTFFYSSAKSFVFIFSSNHLT